MPRGGERPGPTRSAGLAVAAVTVLVVLVVLVAALAATTGPTRVFEGVGPVPERVPVDPSSASAEPEVSGQEPEDPLLEEGGDDGSLRWIGIVVRAVLLALVVAALMLAAAFWVRRRPRRRGAGPDVDVDPDFAMVDPVAAVSAAVVLDAEEQDAALQHGSPRNGIVEAWLRFEVHAARAGAPREPWETSAEFTVRLLDAVGADADATERLAALYRQARFSDHEVGEDERAAAADALSRIRVRLVREGR